MTPSESPFSNTAELKELLHQLDGSFEWLRRTPKHDEWPIGERMAAELPRQLESAVSSSKAAGIRLPPEFVAFIGDPELHEHLRSVSACFLDVAESVLPLFGGHLIRFLADQQGCAFWYIFIKNDGDDHCVLSSFEYFDADEMDYEIEDIEESDFQFQAESFEAFLSRFWIENEILFAEHDSTPPPDVDPRFLKLYAQPGA